MAKSLKNKARRFKDSRIDLSAALRWAAHLGLNEGVCNHFSFEVAPGLYLINPPPPHSSPQPSQKHFF